MYAACGPPYEMACGMGAKLLILNGTGTAGSFRPYAICENLATNVHAPGGPAGTDRVPVQRRATGTVLIEWQELATLGVAQSMPFDSIGFVAPISVGLRWGYRGFVGIERAVIVGVLGSARHTLTLPTDWWGIFNAIYHRWLVQRYSVGDILTCGRCSRRPVSASFPIAGRYSRRRARICPICGG